MHFQTITRHFELLRSFTQQLNKEDECLSIMISKTDSERLPVCESTKRRQQKTNGTSKQRESYYEEAQQDSSTAAEKVKYKYR